MSDACSICHEAIEPFEPVTLDPEDGSPDHAECVADREARK